MIQISQGDFQCILFFFLGGGGVQTTQTCMKWPGKWRQSSTQKHLTIYKSAVISHIHSELVKMYIF